MKRTVIITGGTKGLGRETALAFGRAGYFVIALYSANEAAAESLELAMKAAQSTGCAIKHDIGSESQQAWSHPEIQNSESLTLIHNASAAFEPTPLHRLSWPDFERHFHVAIKGGWQCAQSVIRLMLKKKRCAIVTILTTAIDGLPPKGFGAYVTGKHALRGLTLALAAEYAVRGVRVFSASPGFMNTALTEKWEPRLREIIQAGSVNTNPQQAAQRLVELVESAEVEGKGENYPL